MTKASYDLFLQRFSPMSTETPAQKAWPKWCVCLLAIPVQYGMDPCEVDHSSADAWTMTTVRPHDNVALMRRLMSDYAVTLPVPEEIYDRARQVAAGTAQSVEAVLLQQLQAAFMAPLAPLPPDEQRELEALTSLSDEALWTLAREQMAQDKQARLQVLMDANSQGTLDEAQRIALETLVAQGQRLGVRKAQAAALLTERGYRVTREALASAHA